MATNNYYDPMAEIRELRTAYADEWTVDPLVKIVGENGKVIELRKSQADALVGSANNKVHYVDGVDA